MTTLSPDRFADFFKAMHGVAPYPWQRRLAALAATGDWPDLLNLPTGSGKTSVIDVAIFALACSASRPVSERVAARRIVFCVNRRIIVDEAHDRALRIARVLRDAEQASETALPILVEVARALREVAGTTQDDGVPPLDVLELRGGIYRDNRWARSATQPTVICSTVDQIGSRLLFRGYGVSSGAAPIQAALLAYDSLLFLDEAHISRPFQQTLNAIARGLNDATRTEEHVPIRPLRVVPMSATLSLPSARGQGFALDDLDRADPGLAPRLAASKPVRLVESSKNSAEEDVVREVLSLVPGGHRRGSPAPRSRARSATHEPTEPVAVGVIVNRVATAKAIYNALAGVLASDPQDDAFTLELVIGAMRPIDRDRQADRLRPLLGGKRPERTATTSIVVSTQCLEVGADYDFDVMITELASLDALRQRFGRLNRAGRKIAATGVVIAARGTVREDAKLDDEKPIDPIYGNAAARTWNWLASVATEGSVDFGVDAFASLVAGVDQLPLLSPGALATAPTMLPEHLDAWCQTSTRPTPDPDVSKFIHGRTSAEPDVRVCLRAGLTLGQSGHPGQLKLWADIVGLLPPTSAECMPVPILWFRRWMLNETAGDADLGDALDGSPTSDDAPRGGGSASRLGLIWRGPDEAHLIEEAWQLTTDRDTRCVRPGDLIVISTSTDGLDKLGHLPGLSSRNSPRESPGGGNATSQTLDTPISAPRDGPNEGSPPGASATDGRTALDVAEASYQLARARVALRIHPALKPSPVPAAIDELFDLAGDDRTDWTRKEWQALLRRVAGDSASKSEAPESPEVDGLRCRCKLLVQSGTFSIDRYPDEMGYVLVSRRIVGTSGLTRLPALDDGDDSNQRRRRSRPIPLATHTRHVVEQVDRQCAALMLEAYHDTLAKAAEYHDLGKLDERFQAMLLDVDRSEAAMILSDIDGAIAKSAAGSKPRDQIERARRRAGLPRNFRHEMLSSLIAQRSSPTLANPSHQELLLHLIEAHHGHARPFAPISLDEECLAIECGAVRLSHEDRAAAPPAHGAGSGVINRFHALVDRFGWWGVAYLEAILRLADQQASEVEDREEDDDRAATVATEPDRRSRSGDLIATPMETP